MKFKKEVHAIDTDRGIISIYTVTSAKMLYPTQETEDRACKVKTSQRKQKRKRKSKRIISRK